MAGAYADWRGHVIVCGLRGLGLRIVEQLTLSGVSALVVVDDPDTRPARTLASWGVPHIAASSRVAKTLAGAGHVLVIGLGSVGMQVIRQLAAAGSDILVVEKNENNRLLGQVRALAVPVVIADAALPPVLESG